MSGENVLNYTEQPVSGSKDNKKVFNGTVEFGANAVLSDAANSSYTGTKTFTKPIIKSVETAIEALAGGGQSLATLLTKDFNDVVTVASEFDSIRLPSAVAGQHCIIKNSSANTLSVFPFLADSINAMAVNLSVDIPPLCVRIFYAKNTTVWESKESVYLSAPTSQKGGIQILAVDNTGNTILKITNEAQGQATNSIIGDSGLAADYFVKSTNKLTVAEADILDGATPTTTELNRLDDSAEVESVTAAGAASVTKFITNLNVTSGGAVTLAACPATMIGKIKTIRMATDDGDVTIALTNVQGGTAGTTATFDDIGEELILVGSAGGKWTVIKEFGVTLS